MRIEDRNRRVTDKQGGLLDAAHQAVKIERLEGQQALLAQRVATGMENVANTLANVQTELRHVSARMGEVASLQKSHDSNKESIDKIERSVGALNTRLEEWFDDFDERNNRRWEAFETNRDQWRREHEADNEDTKRDMEKEIRSVRETVIRGIGWGSGVAVLAGLVAAGFMWNLNYRFNDISSDSEKDTARIEAASVRNRTLIDDQIKELVDIKLYLARGGKIPEEPYVPQSQRKDNGQEQRATIGQSAK